MLSFHPPLLSHRRRTMAVMVATEPAAVVPVLPNLSYKCDRCGVRIVHDDDPALVRAVVLDHVAVHHQAHQLGDTAVRWQGYADADTCDKLLDALCGHGWDVWVTQTEVTFSVWKGRPEDVAREVLAIVAEHVGPDLEVIHYR